MSTTQVQFRRGNNAQNLAFTGALGEVTVDTTNNILRVHNGVTAGGFETVSTTGTQTLENKTLNNCTINSPTITGNISGGANLIYGTSLISISGNITAGNIITAGLVSASGNITGNYIFGNGALLTGVSTTSSNINNGTSNVTVVSSGGNVTVGIGGVANVAVFSNSKAVIGNLSVTGNIESPYVLSPFLFI